MACVPISKAGAHTTTTAKTNKAIKNKMKKVFADIFISPENFVGDSLRPVDLMTILYYFIQKEVLQIHCKKNLI